MTVRCIPPTLPREDRDDAPVREIGRSKNCLGRCRVGQVQGLTVTRWRPRRAAPPPPLHRASPRRASRSQPFDPDFSTLSWSGSAPSAAGPRRHSATRGPSTCCVRDCAYTAANSSASSSATLQGGSSREAQRPEGRQARRTRVRSGAAGLPMLPSAGARPARPGNPNQRQRQQPRQRRCEVQGGVSAVSAVSVVCQRGLGGASWLQRRRGCVSD